MFDGASAFNQPLNDWQVDKATNTEDVFKGASAFDLNRKFKVGNWRLTNKTLRKWAARWCGGDREGLPHISTWNTSRVSDMSKLFEHQRAFNDDIGTWDTSGVTSMEWMFMGASSFNQPIGNWRVDKVTNMSSMFHGAKSFNQPLNDWRVDNVTSMGSMFYSASAFNQPLGDWQLRPDCNTCNMFGHPDYNICTNFQNSRPVKKTSRETCCAIS